MWPESDPNPIATSVLERRQRRPSGTDYFPRFAAREARNLFQCSRNRNCSCFRFRTLMQGRAHMTSKGGVDLEPRLHICDRMAFTWYDATSVCKHLRATTKGHVRVLFEIPIAQLKIGKMAGLKRTVRTLGFAAVAEALAIVLLLPQYLPPHPLVWTLIRTVALNFGLFTFYQIFIYPFFVSPLRHLPHPTKVRNIAFFPLHARLTSCSGRPPVPWKWSFALQKASRRGLSAMDGQDTQ
jgi:hypothetical protein